MPGSAKRSVTDPNESPDNDSAFSDNASMLSSESSTSSGTANSGSKKQTEDSSLSESEKITQALEKIKECSIRKLLVKVFCADGSTKSLLIDEAMPIGVVLNQLVEKNHVQPEPQWGVVEQIPELYMERCFEDHEVLMETLLGWSTESRNKILFLSRAERYDMFRRPERYLAAGSLTQWDQQSRQNLLHDFFYTEKKIKSPEIEGPLWIKSEGKKTWKKYHFVLHSSGLYHHGKKAKDLISVAGFKDNQVYHGIGWKKKYKAPTDFGFALKPPHVQTKSTKHIHYMCAENELALHQWVTGIRLVKYGRQLLENYQNLMVTITGGNGQTRTEPEMQRQFAPSSQLQSPPLQYPPPHMMTRSESAVSMSSGCVSETSSMSENGFDAEHPNGGTIKRKPNGAEQANGGEPMNGETNGGTIKRRPKDEASADESVENNSNTIPDDLIEVSNTIRRRRGANPPSPDDSELRSSGSRPPSEDRHLPPPPPPETLCNLTAIHPTLGGSDLSLNSLPPPPEELRLALYCPSMSKSSSQNFPPPVQPGGHPVQPGVHPIQPGGYHIQPGGLPVQQGVQQRAHLAQQRIHPVPQGIQPFQGSLQSQAFSHESVQPQQQCIHQMNEQVIREDIYPCGVPRATFRLGYIVQEDPVYPVNQVNPVDNSQSQMDLLKRLPIQQPPNPFAHQRQQQQQCHPSQQQLQQLQQQQQQSSLKKIISPMERRKKKISFSEFVHSIDDCDSIPLKTGDEDRVPYHIQMQQQLQMKELQQQQQQQQQLQHQHQVQQQQIQQQIQQQEKLQQVRQQQQLQQQRPYIQSTIRNPNPGRLFDSGNPGAVKSTPPREFLNDLQRVMQRKWQVAQKINFRSSEDSTPTVAATVEGDTYNERDVSNWILQSLKHCHIAESNMSEDLCDYGAVQNGQPKSVYGMSLPRHEERPRVYNGRRVPNCYPPPQPSQLNMMSSPHASQLDMMSQPPSSQLNVMSPPHASQLNMMSQPPSSQLNVMSPPHVSQLNMMSPPHHVSQMNKLSNPHSNQLNMMSPPHSNHQNVLSPPPQQQQQFAYYPQSPASLEVSKAKLPPPAPPRRSDKTQLSGP